MEDMHGLIRVNDQERFSNFPRMGVGVFGLK
jgi:hypothetical protein